MRGLVPAKLKAQADRGAPPYSQLTVFSATAKAMVEERFTAEGKGWACHLAGPGGSLPTPHRDRCGSDLSDLWTRIPTSKHICTRVHPPGTPPPTATHFCTPTPTTRAAITIAIHILNPPQRVCSGPATNTPAPRC